MIKIIIDNLQYIIKIPVNLVLHKEITPCSIRAYEHYLYKIYNINDSTTVPMDSFDVTVPANNVEEADRKYLIHLLDFISSKDFIEKYKHEV
jgi:hypothetical protein